MSGSPQMRAVKAVLTKPMHNRMIAKATGLSIHTVNSIIGRLLEAKTHIRIGCAADAGMDDVGPTTNVYAPVGTPMLPIRDPRRKVRARRERTHSGSGQKAGAIVVRGYRYGSSAFE